MKCCVLTDGGTGVGLGHMTRCLSVAQALDRMKISAEFIVHGDASFGTLGEFATVRLDWLRNFKKALPRMKEAQMIVVDSYRPDSSFLEMIAEHAPVPVFFDDLSSVAPSRGVVVDGAIGAEKRRRRKNKSVKYLLGTHYTPLRKEFWTMPARATREELETVLILMGGNDVRLISGRIVEILNDRFPGVRKMVVLGNAESKDQVKALLTSRDELFIALPANELRKVMRRCDVAISAAGQTLYELARAGLPTIAVAVADNQMMNIRGWTEAGFLRYAGCWDGARTYSRIVAHMGRLTGAGARRHLAHIGRKCLDGNGSLRIAEELVRLAKEVCTDRRPSWKLR